VVPIGRDQATEKENTNTMADELRIGLKELLSKAHIEHDADFLKEGVRALSQALMEMEVEEHIGAATSEARGAAATATVTGKGPGTRGRARSSLRCPG
jgi:transposase-like protein